MLSFQEMKQPRLLCLSILHSLRGSHKCGDAHCLLVVLAAQLSSASSPAMLGQVNNLKTIHGGLVVALGG